MRVLDLFSAAAGGWTLGMHRAGFQTVAACEAVEWRRTLYAENNPGIPIYDDVRTLDAGRLVSDLGFLPDIIVGSPPCQDISSANTKGKGVEGERSGLFFEAIRLVGECRPRWFALENSANLRTRGADAVLAALEGIGYACWPLVVRAGDIGANHERPRCWLIGCDIEQAANADGNGWHAGWSRRRVGGDLSVSEDSRHATENGCGQGFLRGRTEPASRSRLETCGNAADAHQDEVRQPKLPGRPEQEAPIAGQPDRSELETSYTGGTDAAGRNAMGRWCGRPESPQGIGFDGRHAGRNTPDPDQAGQADGRMEPRLRQAEIADDGCGDGRSADGPGVGQMAVRPPDSGDPDGPWPLWSLENFTRHVWLDARVQPWTFVAFLLSSGGYECLARQLISEVESVKFAGSPSIGSDLRTALRTLLASYGENTVHNLAPIADWLLAGCNIILAPENTWEARARHAEETSSSRSTTLTKTGRTTPRKTSRPSASPAINAIISERDLRAVHRRAERLLKLSASRLVEAYGDAVVPQIPEAIGRAILRVEAAMSAVSLPHAA